MTVRHEPDHRKPQMILHALKGIEYFEIIKTINQRKVTKSKESKVFSHIDIARNNAILNASVVYFMQILR